MALTDTDAPRTPRPTDRKRTDQQIEVDRTLIAQLYVQGWPQHRIADHLNNNRPYQLTREQISYDLRRVREEWREQRLAATDDWIAEQLARLDAIERESWAAWADSRQPQRISIQHARPGPDGQPRPSSGTVETRPGAGDARYLDLIKQCVQERCKLLGLYPALNANLTINAGGVVGMPAQDVRQLDDGDLQAEITRLEALATAQGTLLNDARVTTIIDGTATETGTGGAS